MAGANGAGRLDIHGLSEEQFQYRQMNGEPEPATLQSTVDVCGIACPMRHHCVPEGLNCQVKEKAPSEGTYH